MTLFHLKNLRLSRVLLTREHFVRSGQHFIRSLLGSESKTNPMDPTRKPIRQVPSLGDFV